VYLLKILIFL